MRSDYGRKLLTVTTRVRNGVLDRVACLFSHDCEIEIFFGRELSVVLSKSVRNGNNAISNLSVCSRSAK